MANYLPNPNLITQVPNHSKAEFSYLFRKSLAKTDMDGEFYLTGESDDYINALPNPLLNSISSENGLQVMLYSYYSSCLVTLKMTKDSKFAISKDSWSAVVALNDINSRDEIDCWAAFENQPLKLSLVLQKVGEDATASDDTEEEEEEEDVADN